MSAFGEKLSSCWKRFCGLHGFVKLAIGAVLILLVVFDLMPKALRWPGRILGAPLAIWGFVEAIFVIAGRSPSAILVSVIRHPLTWVFAITGINLAIGEEYPFSHFPMYADPGPTSEYYFLATVDADGKTKPLPVRALTTLTSAKAGKIYRSKRQESTNELGLENHTELKKKDRRECGLAVLEDLREDALRLAEEKRQKGFDHRLDDIWRFVRIDITVEGTELIETEVVLAERDFSKQ
ncbi:MAG: hypothetical protein ACI8UO_002353 [Verrucomicrobiales bacterium]|jgi:hypothetical protein